jgi:antitoxin VapB
MRSGRHVKRFQNGRNQVGFELPGDKATTRREGNEPVIEPLPRTNLLEWLATIAPFEEEFPEIKDETTNPENIF